MKNFLALILLLWSFSTHSQAQTKLEFGKEYPSIKLTEASSLTYIVPLTKDGIYQFSILQRGIAVYYTLTSPDNKTLYESNFPEDTAGYEKFEYSPVISGNFTLTIKRFDNLENTSSGLIDVFVKSLTESELVVRRQIRKELEAENAKTVTTVDINHFWSAFDNLKKCRTFSDSVNSFQRLYLDRATNGLLDFIRVRDLTAEKFVRTVAENLAFYQSVRQNTYEAKKAEPVVEKVFARFKDVYADFKPFKVCFAIGIKNTGGTVSSSFVLIGTEVTTSTSSTSSVTTEEIIQRIEKIVAHECVHTQQKVGSKGIQCPLLYQSIKEGACDFIAELVTEKIGQNEYGESNENQLWVEFKNELCNQDIGNWLYNGFSVKAKPSDLGYFIGYQISKEYYKNSTDRRQAVVDIIGMTNPIRFLELSQYDKKVKK